MARRASGSGQGPAERVAEVNGERLTVNRDKHVQRRRLKKRVDFDVRCSTFPPNTSAIEGHALSCLRLDNNVIRFAGNNYYSGTKADYYVIVCAAFPTVGDAPKQRVETVPSDAARAGID